VPLLVRALACCSCGLLHGPVEQRPLEHQDGAVEAAQEEELFEDAVAPLGYLRLRRLELG